ncbi:hypothetical protein V6N11_031184 [Hibiscus sabdariffa]|uniref:Uncharacterized protein n=1 Tax=Hibiscus sabdariffa TaxID=183260 RepID=A0ABR2AH73_9ROSI
MRNKKISEDIQGLELSGRSLSDSDLRIKWERAKLEAKAALELGLLKTTWLVTVDAAFWVLWCARID